MKEGDSINKQQLTQLSEIDITRVDRDTLVDLDMVGVDGASSVSERFRQFLSQIKNPYAFQVGGVAVKVKFTADGKTLGDALEGYLKSIKDGV